MIVPPPSSAALLPADVRAVSIGPRSVQEEIDRTLRFRIANAADPAARAVIADSAAAADLLAKPGGARLTRAIDAIAAVSESQPGRVKLHTITLAPDQDAIRGANIANWAVAQAARGTSPNAINMQFDPPPEYVDTIRKSMPDASPDEARAIARAGAIGSKVLARTAMADALIHTSAWYDEGNIVMAPDTSRRLLASLGMYKPRRADLPRAIRQQIAAAPAHRRDDAARRHHEAAASLAWHHAAHETHHAVTPFSRRKAPNKAGMLPIPEHTTAIEEALASVLMPSDGARAMRQAGATPTVGEQPAGLSVDWKPWNRDHLPARSDELANQVERRYTKGPAMLRELLRMSGIDRRTTDGKQSATDLLQARDARYVPRRVADAILDHHGLDASAAPKLAGLIRDAAVGSKSMSDVRAFLADVTSRPPHQDSSAR